MTREPTPPNRLFGESGANPYSGSPLPADAIETHVESDVEAIRHFHLSHEASITSIGTLYALGTILLALIATALILTPLFDPAQNRRELVVSVGLGAGFLVLSVLKGYLAFGLSKLRPGIRIPAILFSFVGLLAFPLGTLISGYFLYLLMSQKGKTILSEPYQSVLEQTPHIKYKTSIIVWIFLGLLVLVLGIVVTAFVVG